MVWKVLHLPAISIGSSNELVGFFHVCNPHIFPIPKQFFTGKELHVAFRIFSLKHIATNSANGVLIIGEKGIISTNINDSSPLMPKLYLNDGTTEFGPEIEDNLEPEYGHQRKWVDACKAGFGSPEHLGLTSSFDYAGPMTETVLMGNLAIRSYMLQRENSEGNMEFFARKKLLWDGENMRITNMEEANQFVGRTYRDGWEV
jgi:hypothetical protein